MTVVNTETGETRVDQLLDALDCAPIGQTDGEEFFRGRIATIQWLSAQLGVSDTTTRSAVLTALDLGLVRVWDAIDVNLGRRRLLVTAGA